MLHPADEPSSGGRFSSPDDGHSAAREPVVKQTLASDHEDDQGYRPAEEAPIEAPRSWTKAEKERFGTLPRETQEYLAQREQERDTALRRSQNEQAERTKALTVREQQIEMARRHYEQALPALMQTLNDQAAGEFPDIRTQADVEKMAREDWPRFAIWQAHQMKVAAVRQDMQNSYQRQQYDFLRTSGNSTLVLKTRSLLKARRK